MMHNLHIWSISIGPAIKNADTQHIVYVRQCEIRGCFQTGSYLKGEEGKVYVKLKFED